MSHKSRSDRNVKEKHLDEKALAEAKKAFLELLQVSCYFMKKAGIINLICRTPQSL